MDSESAPGFAQWQNNTTPEAGPQYLKFHLWNVTNAEDVMNGATPVLEDVGPYSYREYFVNFNVSFSEDGNTVSYKRYQFYVWDSDTSFPGASEDDLVTVINVPFQAILGGIVYNATKPEDQWWQTLFFDLAASSANSTLFTTLKAKDLIFGYEDPLFNLIGKLKPGVPKIFQLQANETEESASLKEPSVALTGKSNATAALNFIEVDGKDSVGCWATPAADKITGGNGVTFWPGITPDQMPVTWTDQLFRTATLYSPTPGVPPTTRSPIDGGTWVEDPLGNGIRLLQFQVPPQGLLNSTLFPPNTDYYAFGLSGVENTTSCQQGAPVYMSKPHFLDADPWFRDRLSGMHPDPSKHNTMVNVEPITGLALEAAKRLQVNVRILPDFGLLYPKVIPDLYVPLAWIEETGHLTQAQADQFLSQVYGTQHIITAVRWVGVGLGAALLILAIVSAVRTWKSRNPEGYTAIQ